MCPLFSQVMGLSDAGGEGEREVGAVCCSTCFDRGSHARRASHLGLSWGLSIGTKSNHLEYHLQKSRGKEGPLGLGMKAQ